MQNVNSSSLSGLVFVSFKKVVFAHCNNYLHIVTTKYNCNKYSKEALCTWERNVNFKYKKFTS